MKVFHHNDIDGHASAAIIRLKYGSTTPIQFIECDYTFPLSSYVETISSGEQVFIVDYSFKSSTLGELLAICERAGIQNVTWIDHHQTSLKLQDEFSQLRDMQGIRKEGISGAALTWMYLYKKEFSEIPLILQHISDYDCYIKSMPQTDAVYHGILADDWSYDSSFWQISFSDDEIITFLYQNGSTVLNYLRKDNRLTLKKWSFETEFLGYKCLAINRKVNSEVFGEDLSQYPLYCIFQFNGTLWRYTIYSKQLDCTLLAAKYGGGGHKGASGFSHPDCLFLNSNP